MRSGNAAPQTIDEYLAKVPEPHKSTLEKIRAMVRAAAPKDATEAISYGMPAFKYKGGLVGFAAFNNHCSFFPMNSALVVQFADELKNYKTSKGTIQFLTDKPLPASLVKKMVKARVADNDAKEKKKKA